MWMNKVLSYYFSCQSLCLLALIPQCRTDMKIVRRSFKNRRAAQKAPITSCCLSRFLSAVTVSEWLPLQLSLVKKLNKICFLEDLDFFSHNLLFESLLSAVRLEDVRAHTHTHTHSPSLLYLLSEPPVLSGRLAVTGAVRLAHLKKTCLLVSMCVSSILFSYCEPWYIIHVKPRRERYSRVSHNTTATSMWLIPSDTYR